MSRLNRTLVWIPLLAAGLAITGAIPAEAGPRGQRSQKVEKHNAKPRAHRAEPRARARNQHHDRDHAYRAPHGDQGRRHSAHRSPRFVVRAPHRANRVVNCAPPYRPWYEGAHRVYVQGDPFFFHAGFGVYLGGLALSIEIGDTAPAGCGFYDPYCGTTFAVLDGYADHCRQGRHDPVLSMVVVDRNGWGR